MNEKEKSIAEAAIKLFAQKGFDSTSIREISEHSGISKGAFYLHFQSKEALVLSIFQYYSEKIEEKTTAVDQEDLVPREKLIRQLKDQFEEILTHREVILLQFREQILYMNEDIEHFFREEHLKREHWLESSFLAIYGESVRPYLRDTSRLFQGMLHAYQKIMIVNNVQLDIGHLAAFIVRRLDNIVNGLITDREAPMLTEENTKRIFKTKDPLKRDISRLLSDMERALNKLSLKKDRQDEMQATLDFLKKEIQKEDPQKFIFKGLLANFDGIEEITPYRQEISEKWGFNEKERF